MLIFKDYLVFLPYEKYETIYPFNNACRQCCVLTTSSAIT